MEIVIPPRDHGASVYQYTWDENGDVMQVTKVDDQPEPRRTHRARGRQTVQWPFQSIATVETSLLSQLGDSQFPFRPSSNPRARRATWEPKRLLPRSRGSDSYTVARDLVPDYVINYLRGETPETVARRKKNGGKLGEREVDIVTPGCHRPHQSRAAVFEGFFDDVSMYHEADRAQSPGDGDEEYMLGGSSDKKQSRRSRSRGWKNSLIGWRGGVSLNVLLALLVFLTGFICFVYAAGRGQLSAHESAIFSGSCSRAQSINSGVQALMNVLAVVLLAGGNYVFQLLSNPTRDELDAAHAKKRWLDIGVASVRNLAHIAKRRVALASTVLLMAVATQVIFNSVISTSRTAADYNTLVVTPSFLKGAPFSNATSNNEARLGRLDILSLQDLANRDALVALPAAECRSQFTSPYQTDYKSVLLVTTRDSTTSSLVQTATSGSSSKLDWSAVKSCLAQPSDTEQTCNVNLNGSLLGVAVLLNLITVLSTAAILFRRSFRPLVSLGDAISSFLQRPDPTTTGSCLLSKKDICQQRWGFGEAKSWTPRRHFWISTPSISRWCITAFFWLSLIALTAAALALSILSNPTRTLSSFGTASSYGIHLLPSGTPASGAAILAALPQLLLAVLYLTTNSLLTTYYLSHEFSLYALGKPRALRVTTSPASSQTTSLYLTLPRPWSWFLVTLFAAMAFVLSKSVFAISVHITTATQSSTTTTTLIGLGFSGTGLLVLLILLTLLALTVLLLGFRRAPPSVLADSQAVGNPLVLDGGSCSAVLSARCHATPQERDMELWKRPLTWGVVDGGGPGNVAHCTFTAGRAGDLDVRTSYA